MEEFFGKRWPLLLVLIIFVAVKIPVLHYPFFWDESWSYAPGVRLMYDHGPSLMPNAIDTGFSRGHPLLFYASAAAWMKLFGISHVTQHSFSLFIACLTLILIYEACHALWGQRMAVIALLLTATQVMFFVQSTLLLPEIMVALFSIGSIYYYSRQQHIRTFLCLSALLLTKESGAAIALVIGLHAVASMFNKAIPTAEKLKRATSVGGAALVIAIFFIIQRRVNGWWFYPEHMSYINAGWELFKGKLRFSAEIIFGHQYRYLFFTLLAVLSLAAAIIKKDKYLSLPAVLFVLLWVLSNEYAGYITRRLYLPFVAIAITYTFYQVNKHRKATGQQTDFIYLSVFSLFAYLSFCCLNFFTDRYLLTALVLVLFLTAYMADTLIMVLHPLAYYTTVAAILMFAVPGFAYSNAQGDVELQVYNSMDVQQAIVNYMEEHNLYNNKIAAPSSLTRAHLTQPYTGFLKSGKTFSGVNYIMEPTTEYFIIDNIEPDTSIHKSQLQQFNKIYSITKGEVWAEIYRHK